jgi:4'-phosphopantetheinyl transferase
MTHKILAKTTTPMSTDWYGKNAGEVEINHPQPAPGEHVRMMISPMPQEVQQCHAISLARPQKTFELLRGDVHLWRVLLAEMGLSPNSLWRVLDSEEKARAREIKVGVEKLCFVRGRGMLRVLLSQYCGLDPRSVRLAYGWRGKPILAEGGWQRKVRFSLSHSYGVALYGFAVDAEIGVDIEKRKQLSDQEELVRRFFSEDEKAAYFRTPLMARQMAFFRTWTAKEAYSKMTGEGFSWRPSVVGGSRDRVSTQTESCSIEAGTTIDRASVVCLDRFPGFAAALAVAGSIRSVKLTG